MRDNGNIVTKPKSINVETYTVLFDDYLPTCLQDMKNKNWRFRFRF